MKSKNAAAAAAAAVLVIPRWSDKIHGSTLPVDGPYWAYTLHEPLGVVGQVRVWGLGQGDGGQTFIYIKCGLIYIG